MTIEPLESVTRICLAREFSAATWLRLIQEARAKETNRKDALETSNLQEAIDIILPLIRNSVSPLSESYLQACLDADESKIYLLRKLLEDEVVLTLKSAGDIKLNAYLECLAATLLASDPAIATKVQTMSTTSKSVEYLNASIKLLSIAAQNQLSSLFLLMLQFLQDYQNQHATHSDDQTNQAIGQEISTCRNLLVTITSAAATVPYPFELAHKLLNTLERTYDPISHRRNSLVRPTTFPSIPVEIEFLVQSTLLNNCQDAPSTFAGSLAARFAMHQAISADQNGDGAQVVLNAWYGDLFSYCSEHAPLLDEPKSRTGARKRAFVFGYLPGLLLGLRNDSRLSSTMLNWNTAVAAGMEKCKERSEQSGQGDLSELSQAMREFISDAEKPPAQISDYSADGLLTLLEEGLYRYGAQKAAAAAMDQHLMKWTAASDLPVLHHFLTSLPKETPRVMDYLLLHCSVEALLKPICEILDAWNSSEEYGAGQAMELYGGIFLALKTIIQRHGLQDNVANFGLSICSALVASSSVLGSVNSLQALTPQDRKLVSSWITALFGSEGIEDDLIRSTPPRTMLLLSPTIVHQSVTAMESGIIDHETLLNGLSYFCQDFLTFTLPGIISYLASRDKPNLQIIKSLLMSESTPTGVFEVVQDDLRDLLRKVDRNDEEAKLLQKRVKHVPIAIAFDQDSITSIAGIAGSVELAAACTSKSKDGEELGMAAIRKFDPLTASLIVSHSLQPVSAATFQTFVRKAINRASMLDDDLAKAQQIDSLADVVALVIIRNGLEVRRGDFLSLPSAFRERLSTWVPYRS